VHPKPDSIYVLGEGASAILAAYAALLEPDIAGLFVYEPPGSHMDESAPALLNVLRVCDIPEALGMLAPRRLTLSGNQTDGAQKVAAIYQAANAADKLTFKK